MKGLCAEPPTGAEIGGSHEDTVSDSVILAMAARLLVAGIFLCISFIAGADAQTLYEGNAFTITDTSVVQDSFRAEAPSRTTLLSNYQRNATVLSFTFALIHSDGEVARGHRRRLRVEGPGERLLTPVYVFGEGEHLEAPPRPTTTKSRASGDSVAVTFRVDLRPVLRQFRTAGSFTSAAGDTIVAADFEGMRIRGIDWPRRPSGQAASTDPTRLTDPVDDGVYRTTLVVDRPDVRPLTEDGRAGWTLSADLSGMPTYTSDHRLVDALYTLSMEEVLQHRREDGSDRAGDADERTQAVSHSTLLSLALVDPDGAKASLMRRADQGRIQADPGRGSGWPIVTDRMTWALAAWEVFKTTGDTTWLRRSYDIIRRSANADLRTAVDPQSGLFYGAAARTSRDGSFYPAWMQPADVYQSQALSTNVVHYRTYRILTQMAEVLGKFPDQWARVARRVKQGINEQLWQPEAGRYVAYRYGRAYPSPVQRTEALGQALVVLSGVTGAARARRVAENQPVLEFGLPALWPSPHHEASDGAVLRPVVNAYWTWASAAAQNAPGVEHGLASLYRATALFRRNEDAMVASTGHFEGAGASSTQLGSAAGLLATVYRVFFGMRATTEGLKLAPFVPSAYSGTHTLEGMPYRDATLDITMKGHGTRIVQVTLDGEPLDAPIIPPDLTGRHDIQVLLSGGLPDGELHRVEHRAGPSTPVAERTTEGLAWTSARTATASHIFRNGSIVDTTRDTRLAVGADVALAEYQVQAVAEDGSRSFRSAPVRVIADTAVEVASPRGSLATAYGGYTGNGYRRLPGNATDSLTVTVPDSGAYALDLRYANGHGGAQAGSATAMRALRVGDERVGTAVLPPHEEEGGTRWGYSNVLRLSLAAGTHTVVLVPETGPKRDVRTVYLDHVRLTPLAGDSPVETP